MEFVCITGTNGEIYLMPAAEVIIQAESKTNMKIFFGKFSIQANSSDFHVFKDFTGAFNEFNCRRNVQWLSARGRVSPA
jgi:hypothetical protein